MNELQVVYAIESCVERGMENFIIYPYGTIGQLVKRILNDIFGIKELAIVDNGLADNGGDFLKLTDLDAIDQEYTILLSSDNPAIWDEIRAGLDSRFKGKVIDIASMTVFDYKQFELIRGRMQIDECDALQTEKVFERTQMTWKKLGESEPYWSVVTHDEFRSDHIDKDAIRKFYSSGYFRMVEISSIMVRNGIVDSYAGLKDMEVAEIGCGCGRVTKHLARGFRKVVAADISAGNLSIAQKEIKDKNVEFRLLKKLPEYAEFPMVDVAYSYLVLQHNCPPVMEYIIAAMMRMVKGRGIVIFQIPTYKWDYSFSYDDYISKSSDAGRIEMHVLPQKRIFEIAYDNSCIPLEIFPCDCTGQDDHSMWFVFRKKGE